MALPGVSLKWLSVVAGFAVMVGEACADTLPLFAPPISRASQRQAPMPDEDDHVAVPSLFAAPEKSIEFSQASLSQGEITPLNSEPTTNVKVHEKLADTPTALWWENEIAHPIREGEPNLHVDVTYFMELAIRCSEQVKAVSMNRWIRGEQTTIANAEFDPELFANGRFDDTSDPVGNSLVTGGPPRLNEHRAMLEAGLKRKAYSGASLSLSQQIGHDNSNSIFFIPNDQGNSRLSLEVRQPLLEGRGRRYNSSFIITTYFDTEQAEAEYLQALQDRLYTVGTSYWNLYRERATLLQRRRHAKRAIGIAQELEQRQVLDALRSQVLRAKAAVANRNSELAVAEAELRNTESRIRALVNAPCLLGVQTPEFLPAQPPPCFPLSMVIEKEVSQALRSRPEIRTLIAQSHAADVRESMAQHELLPTLDLVVESYVSGLEGESRVGDAWINQYNDGAPSYGVGLEFSAPLGNRAAQARLRQRRFEQSRLNHLIRDQAASIRSEIEIASRNATAACQTIQSRRLSLQAVTVELQYLTERWERLRGDPNLGQLQLDDLLNAQVRLFEEERSMAASQAAYGTAIIELQRATGDLVRCSSLLSKSSNRK